MHVTAGRVAVRDLAHLRSASVALGVVPVLPGAHSGTARPAVGRLRTRPHTLGSPRCPSS